MNNASNNKHKFNVIDFFIVIALIAAVAFAVNVIRGEVFGNELQKVEYVLRISGVSKDNSNAFSLGDKIYSADSGCSVGTITDISSGPRMITAFNYDTSRFTVTESDTLLTLYITLSAECYVQSLRLYAGEQLISANVVPRINLPFLYDKCEIVSVEKISDGGENQ